MAAVKIRELPEEDRPREKLLKRGADALTNRELIAILLRTGVRGKNAVEVGGEILEKYKTLSGLTQTSASELERFVALAPPKQCNWRLHSSSENEWPRKKSRAKRSIRLSW